MRYGSVCSGIESATTAWHPLGWQPVWFSEIEPFPCKLLAYHYPHVPNLGDMLKLRFNETFQKSDIDLLVGGTPCQSFSIAGLRGGLADSRGNLALEFCRILAAKRPRWFVWENVPGVFSSSGGKDFRSILQGFRECGYSISWRVLDAKYFGVPQRRRRVFVVGYLGDDWRPSATVLFEPQSMRRHPEKGGKEGKEVTGTIGKRTGGHSIGAEEAGGNMLIMATGQPNAEISRNLVPSLNCDHEQPIIFQYQQGSGGSMNPSEIAPTLHKGKNPAVMMPTLTSYNLDSRSPQSEEQQRIVSSVFKETSSVRRLTPLECERLQGFRDGWTAIPGAKDSPRYSAIGNSMAVPVMRWIGKRIEMVDNNF